MTERVGNSATTGFFSGALVLYIEYNCHLSFHLQAPIRGGFDKTTLILQLKLNPLTSKTQITVE
jgi:hypothetical protein